MSDMMNMTGGHHHHHGHNMMKMNMTSPVTTEATMGGGHNMGGHHAGHESSHVRFISEPSPNLLIFSYDLLVSDISSQESPSLTFCVLGLVKI